MKKVIYLLILVIFMLAGCSKKDQMTNFIPTQTPEEQKEQAAEEELEQGEESEQKEEEEADASLSEVRVGKTTPMYVKLDQYGAYLNVRSNPTTEGAPVGFLVHGEEIGIIEIKDGWASFLYDDNICYVNAGFLVEEQPEYLNPPTPTPTPVATPTKKAVETKPEI